MNFKNNHLIDLSEKEFIIILNLIQLFLPAYEIWAFGSRINGKAKKYSDFDLVIIDDFPVDNYLLIDFKEKLSESSLNITVDVLEWNSLSVNFQRIILKEYVVIQEKLM